MLQLITLKKEGLKMEILYQDHQIIVCIKEVGMDSEKEVPALLKELCKSEIHPLHRLDLNVGGVMVYAKNKQSAALFSKIIRAIIVSI